MVTIVCSLTSVCYVIVVVAFGREWFNTFTIRLSMLCVVVCVCVFFLCCVVSGCFCLCVCVLDGWGLGCGVCVILCYVVLRCVMFLRRILEFFQSIQQT